MRIVVTAMMLLIGLGAFGFSAKAQEPPSIGDYLEQGNSARFCKLVRIILMEKDGATRPQKDAVRQADCAALFPVLHEAFTATLPDGWEDDSGGFLLASAQFCSELAVRAGVDRQDEQTLLCGVGVIGDRYEGVVGQLMYLKDAGLLSGSFCSDQAAGEDDRRARLVGRIKAAVAADPSEELAKLFSGLTDTQCAEGRCSLLSPYWFAPHERNSLMSDRFSPFPGPVEISVDAAAKICITAPE